MSKTNFSVSVVMQMAPLWCHLTGKYVIYAVGRQPTQRSLFEFVYIMRA